MAKKEKLPSTPESRAKKLDRKAEKRSIFGKTFQMSFAIMLSLLLVYSVCTVAFTNQPIVVQGANTNNTNNSNNNTSNNTSNNNSSSQDDNTPGNTDSENNGETGNNDSNGSTESKVLSNSSSTQDVVNYFNAAINKVKSGAKQITLVREENKEAGGIQGNLPKTLTSIADSLVSANMGEKDLSKLDANAVNATTVQDKNAMFPVENETWSSKLTADDVESKEVKDNGSTYTITLNIKPDDLSPDTAHGYGHNGKVFSVIQPTIITENAGVAARLIKNIQTGHKDGRITITVDKATGNVTSANYFFVWTLGLTALGADLQIPFGLEKDFTIAW